MFDIITIYDPVTFQLLLPLLFKLNSFILFSLMACDFMLSLEIKFKAYVVIMIIISFSTTILNMLFAKVLFNVVKSTI